MVLFSYNKPGSEAPDQPESGENWRAPEVPENLSHAQKELNRPAARWMTGVLMRWLHSCGR